MKIPNAQKPMFLTLSFYWISLLLYSIYVLITTGELGMTYIIFNAGMVVFYGSSLIYRQKK